MHHDMLRGAGVSLDGYAELVLIAADPEAERTRRADALWCMGQIARLSEPDLAMGNAGLSYFVMAPKHVPGHVPSCIDIITLYNERPDGHDDRTLAERCINALVQQHRMICEQDKRMCQEQFRLNGERFSELSQFDTLCAHVGVAETQS